MTPAKVDSLAGGDWQLELMRAGPGAPAGVAGSLIPAALPGCVHEALIDAGVITHPDHGFAERDHEWIGRSDWRFRRVVHVDTDHVAWAKPSLVIDGLDTVATVTWDGHALGSAASMHHPHRFLIPAEMFAPGTHDLAMEFTGAMTAAERAADAHVNLPRNGDWEPYNYVRRMACGYRWDWGPLTASCGVWNSIVLTDDALTRIESVRPLVVSCDTVCAQLEIHVDVGGAVTDGTSVEVLLREPETERLWHGKGVVTDGHAMIAIEVNDPRRWWPRGLGGQTRYDLAVRAGNAEHHSAIGLRSIELDTSDGAFTLHVNGAPVFCCGANWIPAGLFPGDMTEERVTQLVARAAYANMNMLRVWGGGRYESHAFYDACDRHGILVWQDVMCACATYPETDDMRAAFESEVVYQAARLARHPSVALWCGGNEDILAHHAWGFAEKIPDGTPWGERYWRERFPAWIHRVDPTRPYWADSPLSSERTHPNDENDGDRHTWDLVAHDLRTMIPRFMSEFGHQSPPMLETLHAVFDGKMPTSPEDPALTHRQRAGGGFDRQYREPMQTYLDSDDAVLTSFEQWHPEAQRMQAIALSIGIEWLRANRPRCMGVLIWQLNDVWSGLSWSIIDIANRPKPAFRAVADAFAERLMTVQPIDGRVMLVLVNDGRAAWEDDIVIRAGGQNHVIRCSVAPGGGVVRMSLGSIFDVNDAELGPVVRVQSSASGTSRDFNVRGGGVRDIDPVL